MQFAKFFINCNDLRQCETAIREHLEMEGIKWLGSLPLTEHDLSLLDSLVVDEFSKGLDLGTRNLTKGFPLCFALFLVWQGIKYYHKGDYWSALNELFNGINGSIQNSWGKSFIRTIERTGLQTIDDDSGLPYVGPILFQGGIPNSCLPEFFTEIIWKQFVSQRIIEKHEVRSVFEEWWHESEKIGSLYQIVRKLDDDIKEQNHNLKQANEYLRQSEANNLTSFSEKIDNLKEIFDSEQKLFSEREYIFDMFRDTERDMSLFSDEEKQLLLSKESYIHNRRNLARAIINFRHIRKRLSNCSHIIKEINAKANSELKQIRKNKAISLTVGGISALICLTAIIFIGTELPAVFAVFLIFPILSAYLTWRFKESEKSTLSQLEDHLKNYEMNESKIISSLVTEIGKLTADETNFLASKLEELHKGNGLLTKPELTKIKSPNDYSVLLLQMVKDFLNEHIRNVHIWKNKIKEAEIRHQNFMRAESEFIKIKTQLECFDARIDKLREQNNEILKKYGLYENLPLVSVKVRLQWIKEKSENLKELQIISQQSLKKLEKELATCIKHVSVQTIKEFCEQTKQKLKQLKLDKSKLVGDIQLPLSQTDRPIQRFLLYSHQYAEEIVQNVITLQLISCEIGNPKQPEKWPASFRYKVIYDSYVKWWDETGKYLCREKLHLLRPALVCWKEGGDWIIGIKLPKNLNAAPDLEIMQDGNILDESNRAGCWKIKKLSGTVVVRWKSDDIIRQCQMEIDTYRQLDEQTFLFDGWDGHLKALPVIKNAHVNRRMVAVVPNDYIMHKYKEHSEPENVLEPKGYQLFCYIESNIKNKALFKLKGTSLPFDTNSVYGPIFVERTPTLSCTDEEISMRLSHVVLYLSDEVIWENKVAINGEIQLPFQEPSGCFELVVFDSFGYEIERIPFRYLAKLKNIKIEPEMPSVFPKLDNNCHEEVKLIFSTVSDCEVSYKHPITSEMQTFLTDKCSYQFSLPVDAIWDQTSWEIKFAGEHPVPLEIKIHRCWWMLSPVNDTNDNHIWTSSLLELKHEWMQASSDKEIRILHPGELFDKKAIVAMEGTFGRHFIARKGIIMVPLRDFFDTISSSEKNELAITLRFDNSEGMAVAGQIAVYRRPTKPLCEICKEENVIQNKEVRSRTCSTCECCRHYKKEYYCTHNKWEKVNSKNEFELRWQTYVCDSWRGEYAGELFEQGEHANLKGKKVKLEHWARDNACMPEEGSIVSFSNGYVQIGGSKGKGVLVWLYLCKLDFCKYYKIIEIRSKIME